MRKYNFYKHKECVDVCIEILKIQYQDSKRLKARARWWNLGFRKIPSWVIRENDYIEISADQFKNWVLIS